jgi:hypothetical protein
LKNWWDNNSGFFDIEKPHKTIEEFLAAGNPRSDYGTYITRYCVIGRDVPTSAGMKKARDVRNYNG